MSTIRDLVRELLRRERLTAYWEGLYGAVAEDFASVHRAAAARLRQVIWERTGRLVYRERD